MFELGHAVLAYLSTTRSWTRASLMELQRQRLERWLARDVPRVAYYDPVDKLEELPIIDKQELMSNFGAFNCAGVSARDGWRAFEGSKRIGAVTVGASTGTSGNRGLFVISNAERFRWLGTILGKALPGFWGQSHRVAVLLPLNTPLYDSANKMRRLSLRFFDIGAHWEADLLAFDPTVLIAPPKTLRAIASSKLGIRPQRLFSGAETLDPLDRAVIEGHFNLTLGQIYMATEGLLAVSCKNGTLHLCEDTMHFDLPKIDSADPDLREVIISDFSRSTQIMARYRMNDLVRLGPPCDCGLPHRTLAEVVGRKDDCFDLPGGRVTPDVLRNAVVDADRQIMDFRIVQMGPAEVKVLISPQGNCSTVKTALQRALQRRGLRADVTVSIQALSAEPGRKLRRVEKRWQG